MRWSTVLLMSLAATVACHAASHAADVCGRATVLDGDTLKVEGRTFRLDGIDAPATDQPCLDVGGAKWACGIDARDSLSTFINERRVCCTDVGPDRRYRSVRFGRCRIADGNESLNQRLVREGWALDLERASRGRFKPDEQAARSNQRGMWRGCFVPPWDFRNWNKSKAPLLGPACSAPQRKLRDELFPADADPPPRCPAAIKANIRSRWLAFLGRHRGIYHLPGCNDYRRSKINRGNGDRWFCSEEEAIAADFRKSINCK
jgi:endonuclease YncB( thermonuclease family)